MSSRGTNKSKILLTDGNYKHTWAAARAIASSGYIVDVIGGNRSISSKSKHVRKNVFNINTLSNNNLNKFLEIIKKEQYNIVLGIGASSIKFLSDNREQISKYVKLLLPPKQSLAICLDKIQTMKFASAHNICIPKTYLFKSMKDVNYLKKVGNFPIIIKSADEVDKKISTLYISSREDLDENLIEKIFALNSSFIAQERIFGGAEAFFAIYKNGLLIDYMMHERMRENPITGGPSTKARSIYKQDLYTFGKLVLDKLKWNGVAMVEFKRDTLGQLHLLEINPKFWGSLDLALATGVNFPTLAVKIAAGKNVTPKKYHARKKVFQWPLDGDLELGVKNPKLLPYVIVDLINPKINKNIYLNDLSPSIHTIINKTIAWFFNFAIFYETKNWAYKVNSHGVRIGSIRWFTETTGIPIFRYSKITESIYLGARLSRIGVYLLRFQGISSVLNLQDERSNVNYRHKIHSYAYIPIIEFDSPTMLNFEKGIQFINDEVNKGNKVYVHCAEGIGRAPTMVSAYFISQGLTVDEAVNKISKIRPFINILDNQFKSLKNFKRFYKFSIFSK